MMSEEEQQVSRLTVSRPVGDAARELPRERFMRHLAELAGANFADIPMRTFPPAEVEAVAVSAVDPVGAGRVVQVGAGLGWGTYLLASVAESVVAWERHTGRAEALRQVLSVLGIGNVAVRTGDGLEEGAIEGPLECGLVSARHEVRPQSLIDALARDGGRLVRFVPVGGRQADLEKIRRNGDTTSTEILGRVPLRMRLGDLLVSLGEATRPAIERAAQRASDEGLRLGEALVAERIVDEESLYRMLGRLQGMTFGTVGPLLEGASTELFESVSEGYLRHNEVLPVKRQGDVVTVATTNPHLQAEELRSAFRARAIKPVLVTPTAFERLWRAIASGRIDRELRESAEAQQAQVMRFGEAEETFQSELVELFEGILFDAASERTSDIHLERYGSRVRVRFRIDGELHDVSRYNITVEEHKGLINIIKVLAELDIAERRLPQGGRFRRRIHGQDFDLRVQTQPTRQGEYAVIRLLPHDNELLSIEELGFPPEIAERYRRLVQSPTGLVLCVGPTGSGKSTTLYSGLQVLAREASKKVITVEDPVEYTIENVQQTQVHPAIGFSFANAMRSFVRQDPDVIMVGEIRDGETALEAIRASQTGHLVLSTLHCNDTVDAVQRLFDLGMHANSIASELIAVFSQRLAKRVCTHCREPVEPDADLVAEVFPGGVPEDFETYRGAGCSRCSGRGTRGRVAVVEFLEVGPKMRQGISAKLPLDELREVAVESGVSTLRSNALRLVKQGEIPFEEMGRIFSLEQLAPPGAGTGNRERGTGQKAKKARPGTASHRGGTATGPV